MPRGWRSSQSSGAEGVVRRHRPDHLIALFTGIIMLAGLVMIYAIGPQRANVLNTIFGYEYSDTYFVIKQGVSFILAVSSFIFAATFPYKWVFKNATSILGAGFILCAALAIAGWAGLSLAIDANGAVRWISLGPLGSLQPAEVLKLGILVYLGAFLAKKVKEGKINDWHETLMPVTVVTALAMLFVVVIQKDLGTGISLLSIIISMIFVAGLSKKNMGKILLFTVAAGIVFVVSAPHRVDRMLTYLKGDDTSTVDAGSYHIQHAKIALGSGGFFGLGIGKSVQASGYLPEAINDSIFAIFGETFGFVGSMALVALFVALLMRILRVVDSLADLRLKYLAAGVFGWLASHVILNIAAMIGILPLTGITLPLMSYGGTSMIFVTAALGLVYQASRYTVHPSRIKEAQHEDSGSRRGVGRTRHSSRRSS